MLEAIKVILDNAEDEDFYPLWMETTGCPREQVLTIFQKQVGPNQQVGDKAIASLQELLVRQSKREEQIQTILTSKGEPAKLILQVLDLF